MDAGCSLNRALLRHFLCRVHILYRSYFRGYSRCIFWRIRMKKCVDSDRTFWIHRCVTTAKPEAHIGRNCLRNCLFCHIGGRKFPVPCWSHATLNGELFHICVISSEKSWFFSTEPFEISPTKNISRLIWPRPCEKFRGCLSQSFLKKIGTKSFQMTRNR